MSAGRIQIHDPGKLFLFALALVLVAALLAIDKVTTTEWALVNVAVISYLTGNGLIASRGKVGSNALGPAAEPLTPTEAAALTTLARSAVRVEEPPG